MLALLALGFSSGLPLGLTGATLQSWMTSQKIDLRTIGLFNLVALPYAIKFLWAPLLDRYVPPLLGRRRGWLVITQILLMLAIAVMGGIGTASLPMLVVVALAVATFSASQDIVADAYRTDVLPEPERGLGTAFFLTGYRLAYLAATGGAMVVVGRYQLPWSTVYLMCAGAMLIGLCASLLAPEPAAGGKPPDTLGDAVILPIRSFMSRDGWFIVLLFIVVFKIPDVMLDGLKVAFLQRGVNFSPQEVGTIAQSYGMLMSIAGTLCGGAVIARIGMWKSLWIFGILQAVSNGGFYGLTFTGNDRAALVAVISIENFCSGLVAAGFVTFLMDQCDARFSATQYALLSSLMALTRSIGAAPTGEIADRIGWRWFIGLTMVAAVPGLLLLPFIRQACKRSGDPTGRTDEADKLIST